MTQKPPLILTLLLDEHSFEFFDDLRQQHFPAAINYLRAHLTLFHQLPNIPAVTSLLTDFAARQPVISLTVAGLLKLGRGVAYKIESAELNSLHAYLQTHWQAWLTPQDQQKIRPHVTVQNKVTPETATALYTQLHADFQPFAAISRGLSLWEYQGGPWQKVQDYTFLGTA